MIDLFAIVVMARHPFVKAYREDYFLVYFLLCSKRRGLRVINRHEIIVKMACKFIVFLCFFIKVTCLIMRSRPISDDIILFEHYC